MLITESLFIDQKPETIWDYWMDVRNDVHWRGGIIKAEWTSEAPYGVGSTGEHTHEQTGLFKWEVTQYTEDQGFEFLHTEGALKGSIGNFQVKGENSGSRVEIQMSISGLFIMRIMMLFMKTMMRKSVRADVEKLKELMEAK